MVHVGKLSSLQCFGQFLAFCFEETLMGTPNTEAKNIISRNISKTIRTCHIPTLFLGSPIVGCC